MMHLSSIHDLSLALLVVAASAMAAVFASVRAFHSSFAVFCRQAASPLRLTSALLIVIGMAFGATASAQEARPYHRAADSKPAQDGQAQTGPSGIISTVVGDGFVGDGGNGGLATKAQLINPWGVAVDSAGNFYIADPDAQVVRKVTVSTGIISIYAGTGFGGYSGDGGLPTAADLDQPQGVAFDAYDNLYIADYRNNVIRKVDAQTGIITTVAGNGVGAGTAGGEDYCGYLTVGVKATTTSLCDPQSVAVDSEGNLYIVQGNRVLKVTASTGILSVFAGTGSYGYSGDGGPAVNAELDYSGGLAVDNAGNLYIADTDNCAIRKVTASTGIITSLVGTVSPSGSYGVCNYSNLGDGGPASAASILQPQGIAVDGTGNIFVADQGRHSIRVIAASNAKIYTVAGSYYTYTSGGTIYTDGNYGYSGDGGPAIAADLSYPAGVAVDPSGNLYIADRDNSVIREVNQATVLPTESPVITPPSGAIGNDTEVTITSPVKGATIHYTTNGSTPSTSSAKYTTPFELSVSATVEAFATISGKPNTGAAVANYVYLPAPTLSPGGKTINGPTQITISDANTQANVCYTTNGGDPTAGGAGVSCWYPTATITVSSTTTVKAAAEYCYNGCVWGPVETATYTYVPQVATPVFSLAPGQYSTAQNVTITDSTAGATIYYAINAAPNASSTKYTPGATITVSATETLEAIAEESGYANSPVASSFYIIVSSTHTLKSIAVTPASGVLQVGSTLQFNAVGTYSDSSTENLNSLVTWTSSKKAIATIGASGVATAVATGSTSISASLSGVTSNSASLVVGPVTPLAYKAPTEPVGTASPTQTATVWIPNGFTLGSISVVTQGATGLDFNFVSGGTCAVGTAYTAAQTCTVNYTFKPKAPGTRMGAINLYDKTSPTPVLQATTYLDGTGTGPLAGFHPGRQLNLPTPEVSCQSAVAVDAGGDVYVADPCNDIVYKETLSAGSYSQSTVASGSISPRGIAVDGSGNVYIADSQNQQILKESPSAGGYLQSVFADSLTNGPLTVEGLAADGSGNVYIGNAANAEVYKETLTANGYTQSTVATSAFCPEGVAVDGNGNVYVAAECGNQVLKATPSGSGYTQGAIASGLNQPYGVAVDASGNLYVGEYNNGNSLVVKESPSASGYVQSSIAGGLYEVEGLALDGSGNLYIAAWANGQVMKLDLSDPPSLSFATTPPGFTSADSPQTITLWNDGNAPLTLPIPASGNNPSISANFTLNSSGASSCPLVAHTAAKAGTLAAGASCILPIGFAPTTKGSLSGSLVFTDNNLNGTNVSQSLSLSGVSLTLNSIAINAADPAVQIGFTDQFTAIATFSDGSTENITAVATWKSSETTIASIDTSGVATGLVAGSSSISANWGGATSNTVALTVSADVPTAYKAPTEPVGTASAIQTATIWIPNGFTLGSIAVVTQGAANLDFNIATGGSCTVGTAYAAGQTCTANYTFKPKAPGTRLGAINLYDKTSPTPVLHATVFLTGAGSGPLVNFLPGTQGVVANNANNGLYYPEGVAVDASGNVYIADTNGSQVFKETLSAGSYTQSVIANYATNGLEFPRSVTVDGSGNVYIADSSNDRVLKETLSTGVYAQTIIANAAINGLNYAGGVAVDGSGNVYIADTYNSRVLKETLSAGGYTQSVVANNANNGLEYPGGVAVDGSGNVYIADTDNSRLLKETLSASSYTQSVVANSATNGLSYPEGVAVDDSGNVYIADTDNGRLLKETLSASSYTQSVVANSATNGLSYPYVVAVDGSGNVYIADTDNDRVLKEDFANPPSLTFATTVVGSTSTGSPRTITLWNDGNAALTFPIPTSGNNPSISTNFTLNSSGASACPLVAHTATKAGTLASGANCSLPVSFTPAVAGTISGSLLLTDNNLNVGNATQMIALGGTGLIGTTTKLSSSLNPSIVGQSVTIKATASAASGTATPTGTVQFSVDGTAAGSPVTLSSGTATYATSALTAGTHSITAVYTPTTGSSFATSSAAALSQVVNKAT